MDQLLLLYLLHHKKGVVSMLMGGFLGGEWRQGLV